MSIYTTQNSIRITFSTSCQPSLGGHIFLFTSFQNMHQNMGTPRIDRTRILLITNNNQNISSYKFMDLLFTDHYLIAAVPHIAAGPADSQQRTWQSFRRPRVFASVRSHNFHRDWHEIISTVDYSHPLPTVQLFQIGLLSVTGERMCTKQWYISPKRTW